MLDMSGNVWEWCRTKWREDYKGKPDEMPEGTRHACVAWGRLRPSCEERALRLPLQGQSERPSRHIGFRVVASPIIHDSGL